MAGAPDPALGADSRAGSGSHLLRRSSTTVGVAAFHLPLRLGRTPPHKRGGVGIPGGNHRANCPVEILQRPQDASRESALSQDLPEALDEVQPRRRSGEGDKMEAGMAPVPQHRVHAPMQRQRIGDQVRLAGGANASTWSRKASQEAVSRVATLWTWTRPVRDSKAP